MSIAIANTQYRTISMRRVEVTGMDYEIMLSSVPNISPSLSPKKPPSLF
jgi:hypothetical protein